MTETDALKTLHVLHAAFPRQALSQNSVALYVAHLEKFDGAYALATVMRLIATLKFFPSISELISELEDSPSPAPAWSEAIDCARRGGGVRDYELDPLLVEAITSFGGLKRLGDSTNTTSDRARFIELYSEIRSHHIAETYSLGGTAATKLLRSAT